jgi:hypothetical protein
MKALPLGDSLDMSRRPSYAWLNLCPASVLSGWQTCPECRAGTPVKDRTSRLPITALGMRSLPIRLESARFEPAVTAFHSVIETPIGRYRRT